MNIRDENPLKYIKSYDRQGFNKVLKSHLLSDNLLRWSNMDMVPTNLLDVFIEERVDVILCDLKEKLSGINIEVIDTVGAQKEENEK